MAITDPNTDSFRARLATWMIPPAGGWRRKSYVLLWNEFSRPLITLGVVLFGILAVGIIGAVEPVFATSMHAAQLVLVTVAIINIGIILYRVSHRLLEPLAHLRNWALRMRGGNLSARIPVPARGEFADLARDINSLADEFKSLTLDMDAQVRAQTERLARKTRSLEILYDVATSLNKSRDLDKLLDRFLDTFIDLVNARAATVRLLTDTGQTRLVASRGVAPETVGRDLPVDTGRHQGDPAALQGGIRMQHGACHRTELLGMTYPREDIREFVVPIQYENRVLGVYNLFLDRAAEALGEDVHDLLLSIGKHLGLAIEKARSDHDARRLAIMEERSILASELHDSLAQSLVSVRLQLKMLGENLYRKDLLIAQNEVRDLRIAVEEAHSSLRKLLANFRLKIDERGLVPAIESMAQRFKQETGISVFFHNECHDLNLSPAQEIQVFHIIQEALANIRKHSHARNARILLNQNDTGSYVVIIEDDGYGMSQISSGSPGEHIGLSVMRERAQRLPGELTIESEPGEGTRVQLTFAGMTKITSASQMLGA